MGFQKYIDDIGKRHATGTAREHAYRPALQNLIEAVIPAVTAMNDPAHIECGAPDFILSRKNIPVGYIEAKDIGDELDKTEKSEQLKRYLEPLENLILTDYLEFRFFLDGEKVETIRIGAIRGNRIIALPENFDRLKTLLVDFAAFQGQTIKSAKKLAEMMAHKARLMRDVFFKAVQDENSTLHEQLKAFKTVLVHDMDAAQFADVYAQTIAYGLFTARLHDESLDDFSRAEALTLIPKSNPFLRQLFHYVAGPDLDDRVVWIIDALCEVYRATDLREILKDFGSATGQSDPILHFYETFLAEYDPKLRKSRGVFYTPEPVVNFIVRAVDDVLKTHFGLNDGLANTSKVKIEVDTDTIKGGKRQKEKNTVHKVQLLDVATGTGTFLAEVVKQVYSRFRGQEGLWSSYVDNDLLPRLHGFELLMASYAMCHMKLDLLLQETGYRPSDPNNPPRVSVYLTNSLEEHHPDMDTLFASWLSREANEASRIKKDMPIMVAFGNPPYSKHSYNKSKWIQSLLMDYKKEPGGKEKLKERNSKWLNDDYVKFIRLGEQYIEKNGEGILAYITNHGYLDNPTFRGMRWHLLSTFDDIYIVDLHGNSNLQETSPDGSVDVNVFDIQQGVAIAVFVKTKKKKNGLGTVYHFDLYGDREKKYKFLNEADLKKIPFKKIPAISPFYYFKQKDLSNIDEYRKGFGINELFVSFSTGYYTSCDEQVIAHSKEELVESLEKFLKDKGEIDNKFFKETTYRPFDNKIIYFDPSLLTRSREKFVQKIKKDNNLILVLGKTTKSKRADHFFITRFFSELKCAEYTKGSYMFPLYFHHGEGGSDLFEVKSGDSCNLNDEIVSEIFKMVKKEVKPEDIIDYVYAILYSHHYRELYLDLLKDDFPRIPYPKDKKTFHALAAYGATLRALHLMESSVLDKLITTYPVDGDHEVKKPRFESDGKTGTGKVWINETQYFGNVPVIAWNFYIGGYQPAQKWLKDRKKRKLSIEDIKHWQRIIVALTETDKVMKDIDKIDFLPQGDKP